MKSQPNVQISLLLSSYSSQPNRYIHLFHSPLTHIDCSSFSSTMSTNQTPPITQPSHTATETRTQGPTNSPTPPPIQLEMKHQTHSMGAAPHSQSEINLEGIVEEIVEELNATHDEHSEPENIPKSPPQALVSSKLIPISQI